MDLTILAPAYYRDLGPVHYLAQSAARYGVEIKWYGIGQVFTGGLKEQVPDLIGEIEAVATSHVIYTDSYDVMVTSGLKEIERRYRRLSAPALLVSTHSHGACAGGWMGERSAALSALRILELWPGGYDPQIRWQQAIAEGAVEAVIDETAEIFWVEEGLRPPTQMPCFLHFAGGYSDPTTGRAERMQPYWEEFGYAGH